MLLKTEDNSTLYVQASYDGITWSESTKGTYNHIYKESQFALKANISPFTSAIFDFYNGHEVEGARTVMGTVYGATISLEADWLITNNIRIYPEIGYAFVAKAQTLIPKQSIVHYFKLGGGVDYLFNITNDSAIVLGLFAGSMWHFNNNNYTNSAYFGLRAGLEKKLTENFTLGAMARVDGALLKTEEAITDSITLLVNPVSFSFSWCF